MKCFFMQNDVERKNNFVIVRCMASSQLFYVRYFYLYGKNQQNIIKSGKNYFKMWFASLLSIKVFQSLNIIICATLEAFSNFI